jgi:glyceraldehyde 3-phosphate dehydrogenase
MAVLRGAGLAVRVPLINGSITDCVFEVKKSTTVEEVNSLLKVYSCGQPMSRSAK